MENKTVCSALLTETSMDSTSTKTGDPEAWNEDTGKDGTTGNTAADRMAGVG